MPEQFHPSQQPDLNPAAEQAERFSASSERQTACVDLASECADTLNQTPEGRIQLVCAEAGLSLQEDDPARLLKNRHLLVAFSRPLPMPSPIRKRCEVILQAELQDVEPPAPEPENPEMAAKQAELVQEEAAEETVETRVTRKKGVLENEQTIGRQLDVNNAAKDNTISTVAAERDAETERADANAAEINELIKTRVSTGNLAHYRAETTKVLEAEYKGEALTNALTVAETVFAKHEQTLNAMQAVFTPEELQTVFDGSLIQTVSLNLKGENKAEIYADVFARIDAGFADDDRRREVRTAVAAQLGIKFHRVDKPANATELQNTLKRGRGTEDISEMQRVEEPAGSGNFVERAVVVGQKFIPFTEREPLVLSEAPRVTIFPKPPGTSQYQVKAAVEGSDPIGFSLHVPKEGAFPTADINNHVNEQFGRAILSNRGLGGALNALFGRGDSSLGIKANTDLTSEGQDEMFQAFAQMSLGNNTAFGGRFYTEAELSQMDDTTRWITPEGDFGAFNQVDPATVISLMTAMFGSSHGEITSNMKRANQFTNTGGAETPSYETLYVKMHPEDAANGFKKLKSIIGKDGMARLNLPDAPDKPEDNTDLAA